MFHDDDTFDNMVFPRLVERRKVTSQTALAILHELVLKTRNGEVNPRWQEIFGEVPEDVAEYVFSKVAQDWKQERETRDSNIQSWLLAIGLFW